MDRLIIDVGKLDRILCISKSTKLNQISELSKEKVFSLKDSGEV